MPRKANNRADRRADRESRGPGRPPLTGRAKERVLQIRLTEAEHAAIRRAAGDHAVSAWVRTLALSAARGAAAQPISSATRSAAARSRSA